MKSLEELINKEESGWELVLEWIKEATNKIEVLDREMQKAKLALHQTQVTTRSPMGAIIYETGGVLIDNGWIRILGSGHEKLNRSLPEWNVGKTIDEIGEQPSVLLIADDVVGGFFGINGGALGEDFGKVYYFAPDALVWEPLGVGYSDFLYWTFTGDLSEFYSNVRWDGWVNEVIGISGNQAFSFFPFLWTEHDGINNIDRRAVPISEIWDLQKEFLQQLGSS